MASDEKALRIPAILLPSYNAFMKASSRQQGQADLKRIAVQCGVCRNTRYYSLTRGMTRVNGVVACEACRHQYQSFKRAPLPLHCSKADGSCLQMLLFTKTMCRCCWVAQIIEYTPLTSQLYNHYISFLPVYIIRKLRGHPIAASLLTQQQRGSLSLEVHTGVDWKDVTLPEAVAQQNLPLTDLNDEEEPMEQESTSAPSGSSTTSPVGSGSSATAAALTTSTPTAASVDGVISTPAASMSIRNTIENIIKDFSSSSSSITPGIPSNNAVATASSSPAVSVPRGKNVATRGSKMRGNASGPVTSVPHGSSIRGSGTAVRGSGSAVRGSGTSVRGSGTAVRGSGTAVRGSGTAVRGSGTAVRGSGTAVRGSGTAVRGSATAFRGRGTAIRGSGATFLGSVPTVRGSEAAGVFNTNAVGGSGVIITDTWTEVSNSSSGVPVQSSSDVQRSSVTAPDGSMEVLSNSMAVQGSNTAIEDDSIELHCRSLTGEASNTATQVSNGAIQSSSAAVQGSSTAVQSSNIEIQSSSTAVQDSSNASRASKSSRGSARRGKNIKRASKVDRLMMGIKEGLYGASVSQEEAKTSSSSNESSAEPSRAHSPSPSSSHDDSTSSNGYATASNNNSSVTEESRRPTTAGLAAHLLKGLVPEEQLKYLKDFNPRNSARVRRKKDRVEYFDNPKEKKVPEVLVFDHKGHFISSDRSRHDACDCLHPACPGCHFPCSKCRSLKCGAECRINRKWYYERVDVEGTDQFYLNPFLKV